MITETITDTTKGTIIVIRMGATTTTEVMDPGNLIVQQTLTWTNSEAL